MKTAYERAAEICPGPDPKPRRPTKFAVPAGAVDTHAHVIGPNMLAQRSYNPPPAAPRDYLHMLDATGMTHGVLVQVSVHGADNSLMLDQAARQPDKLRAIGVAPADLPEQVWHTYQAQGMVGLRLNTLAQGGFGFDQIDRYESLCQELGWHLQLLARPARLMEIAPRLRRLKVPYVIDHMGDFDVKGGMQSPEWQTMLGLVRDGAWTKLSGAYRLSEHDGWLDTVPFAQALIAAAPDRCVWGSDWPHVAHWDRMPNVGELLDLLYEWAPDAGQRDAILTRNAHRLYGFNRDSA